MDLTAHIDGGARGNPGPAAIGVYIEDADGNPLFEEGKTIGHATNNEAEYRALLYLLEIAATDPVIASFAGGALKIHCDSNLIVQQVLGNWKIKEPRLRELYDEVQAKKKQVKLHLRIKHVPREQNKTADALVNQALDGAVKNGTSKAGADKEGFGEL